MIVLIKGEIVLHDSLLLSLSLQNLGSVHNDIEKHL